MTVITTLVREKHLHISPVNCCFLESNIEKNPILVLWLYSKKEELKKHSVWSTLKDVTAGVRLWQNYTVNSRKSHRFWIVCMCVYSVCVRVWSRETLTHRLLLSPSFHLSLFSWAAAVDSFNGKFKQTTPPFSPSHFPPCLLFFGPLSLYLSFFLPPSHLPKHHKAFSALCFAAGVADQYDGKAREREREWGWEKENWDEK